MKLNTRIKTPDGRVGTICYHHLDGTGGVWGRHTFTMPLGGFGDELPEPEFMVAWGRKREGMEYVDEFEVVGDDE